MNTNRTFSELQQAVKNDMQLNPGLISDTERKQFLNDALDDLGTLDVLEKDATITTVNGEVPLPDDFVSIIDIKWKATGRSLNPTKIPTTTLSTSLNPVYYIQKTDSIELLPKPSSDGDVELFYRYRPVHMVDDDDKPDIPNGWDRLLVDYAVAYCHRKNGEIGLFREYKANYDVGRTEFMIEMLKKSNSRITTTKDTSDYLLPETPFDYL